MSFIDTTDTLKWKLIYEKEYPRATMDWYFNGDWMLFTEYVDKRECVFSDYPYKYYKRSPNTTMTVCNARTLQTLVRSFERPTQVIGGYNETPWRRNGYAEELHWHHFSQLPMYNDSVLLTDDINIIQWNVENDTLNSIELLTKS